MNLQHANLNRLDVARKDLRDLKGLGPLVESSLRSDATAQGPRPFKSRRSLRATSNLYLYLSMKNMGSKLKAFSLQLYGECYHVSMKGQLIVVSSKFTTVSLV